MSTALTIAPTWHQHQALLIEVQGLRLRAKVIEADRASLIRDRVEACAAAWIAEREARCHTAERDEYAYLLDLAKEKVDHLTDLLAEHKAAIAVLKGRR